MTSDDYRHFVCIVAGENPDELLKKYDKNLEVGRHVVYKLTDAAEIKNNYLIYLNALINAKNVDETEKSQMEKLYSLIESEEPIDFFDDFTANFDHDDITGDAISDVNENGKWSSYNIGKLFSVPFKTFDDEEKFQCLKGEVDWDKIHHNNTRLYESVWELCMEGRKPETPEEKQTYKNMCNRTTYLKKFGDKKTYVESCTAFWGYAFLSEETGWVDMSEHEQFAWMNSYLEHFIMPLDENTKLTIIECTI